MPKKPAKPLTAQQQFDASMERLLQKRAFLADIYGDKWTADWGTIKGKNRCTIAAGLDSDLASYLVALHNALPVIAGQLKEKDSNENRQLLDIARMTPPEVLSTMNEFNADICEHEGIKNEKTVFLAVFVRGESNCRDVMAAVESVKAEWNKEAKS